MPSNRSCTLRRDQRGFSLIELMVVVLIIAILLAIAIPTFLGMRTRAMDRAAQVSLRQALLTEKTYFTDKDTYAATPAVLTALEPSLRFDSTIANTDATTIGYTGTAGDLVMALQSKSGTYFCIADSASGRTTYKSDTVLTNIDTPAGCDGSSW